MSTSLLATYIRLRSYWNDRPQFANERGAAMVEYALLVALIALVAIVAISTFGQTLGGEFTEIHSYFVDGVDNNPFDPTP